mmetsp:Transcript_16080/g.47566  ORF Transcript_16080/g.47566 Transcript_16080/m.47566 type:complete len:590 (+) Transcript_16080:1278-3047(+)
MRYRRNCCARILSSISSFRASIAFSPSWCSLSCSARSSWNSSLSSCSSSGFFSFRSTSDITLARSLFTCRISALRSSESSSETCAMVAWSPSPPPSAAAAAAAAPRAVGSEPSPTTTGNGADLPCAARWAAAAVASSVTALFPPLAAADQLQITTSPSPPVLTTKRPSAETATEQCAVPTRVARWPTPAAGSTADAASPMKRAKTTPSDPEDTSARPAVVAAAILAAKTCPGRCPRAALGLSVAQSSTWTSSSRTCTMTASVPSDTVAAFDGAAAVMWMQPSSLERVGGAPAGTSTVVRVGDASSPCSTATRRSPDGVDPIARDRAPPPKASVPIGMASTALRSTSWPSPTTPNVDAVASISIAVTAVPSTATENRASTAPPDETSYPERDPSDHPTSTRLDTCEHAMETASRAKASSPFPGGGTSEPQIAGPATSHSDAEPLEARATAICRDEAAPATPTAIARAHDSFASAAELSPVVSRAKPAPHASTSSVPSALAPGAAARKVVLAGISTSRVTSNWASGSTHRSVASSPATTSLPDGSSAMAEKPPSSRTWNSRNSLASGWSSSVRYSTPSSVPTYTSPSSAQQ